MKTKNIESALRNATTPAALMGSARTEAKASAARENGKRGGRPRVKFELSFWGGAMNRDNQPVRYRRNHDTLEAAKAEAEKVRGKGVGAPHSAIIYGPGCGKDGIPG